MDGLRWERKDDELRPVVEGVEDCDVVWAPQPGAQQAFLECPISEVLLEGNRGGGKTDVLIMDFAQHVGKGFREAWNGILFRKTYKQLEDVVSKTKKWFPRIWPSATFNSSKMRWSWPTGEKLWLSYLERDDDYYNYHGHSYTWIAFEELTTWASPSCYTMMMSVWRSPHVSIPKKFRATTNPYGVGHNWVKSRFRLPVRDGIVGKIVTDEEGLQRVAIHSDLAENKVLMTADPNYRKNIAAAARNPSEKAAWLKGDWDIVAGGMFDDLWSPRVHVVPSIPFNMIPRRWRLNRSYDHGQSKPFSAGWWAESNGEPVRVGDRWIGPVPGDLIRISEWYGWNGSPNEGVRMLSEKIAGGIIEREDDWGLNGLVMPGPADSSIFTDFEPGKSVAGDMKKKGVKWTKADNSRGSREQGWEQMRKLLAGAIPERDGTRDSPGLFVCARCDQFIRTFPVLPRDDKKIDDVNTESEDHIADEARYRCREKRGAKMSSRSFDGDEGTRKKKKSWSF